jgi:hypothetical protein
VFIFVPACTLENYSNLPVLHRLILFISMARSVIIQEKWRDRFLSTSRTGGSLLTGAAG